MVSAIQAPIDYVNTIKNNTSIADKFCKIVSTGVASIDALAQMVFNKMSAWKPLSNLAKELKVFSGLIGAFNLVNRVYEFVCKSKKCDDFQWKFWKKNAGENVHLPWVQKGRKHYEWMNSTWRPKGVELSATEKKMYSEKAKKNRIKDDGYWSSMKTGSAVLLTGAHAIEFTKLFDTIGLFALGAALPIMTMVKNILYIPASILGIADCAQKNKMVKIYQRSCGDKATKWRDRLNLEGDQTKASLFVKYAAKIERAKMKNLTLELRKGQADSKELEAINEYVAHKELKMKRWTLYRDELNSGTSGKLNPDSQLAKDCRWKMKEWQKNFDKYSEKNGNIKKEKTKNWLNIANQIGKLACGLICLIGIPLLAALCPGALLGFGLGMSVAWCVTHIFGLTKELYSVYNPLKPIIRPHLQIS